MINSKHVLPHVERSVASLKNAHGEPLVSLQPRMAGHSLNGLLTAWRYKWRRYERSWELDFSKRFIRLWDPKISGL
jgi:hypothetical protein